MTINYPPFVNQFTIGEDMKDIFDIAKIGIATLILVGIVMILCILIDIRNSKIMRVTEVKHIYQIEHYYGDLSFNKENTNVNP